MSMITDIAAKSKGKPGCAQCDGKGTYFFQGCSILCDSCHSEESIAAYYSSIDTILTKHKM